MEKDDQQKEFIKMKAENNILIDRLSSLEKYQKDFKDKFEILSNEVLKQSVTTRTVMKDVVTQL